MRESTTALVRSSQPKEIVIKNFVTRADSTVASDTQVNNGVLKIPKGTLILASVAVNAPDINLSVTAEEVHPPSASPSQLPSQLLKHCDSAVTFTYSLLNITSDSRICAAVSSLPAAVHASFKSVLHDLQTLFKGTSDPSTRYPKVRHDAISYFIPLKSGGTLLVTVMRADSSGLPRIIEEFTLNLDARMRFIQ